MVEHITTPSANRTIVDIRLKRNNIKLLNSNIKFYSYQSYVCENIKINM
jgi:hypothetical protein